MRSFVLSIFVLIAVSAVAAQPPQRPQGPPMGPPIGRPDGRRPDGMRPGGGPPPWAKVVDVNRNGRIEVEEFHAAAEAFFAKYDRNGNGILEKSELPGRPELGRPGFTEEDVPPFLFVVREDRDLSKTDFDTKANERFGVIDANGDRTIDWQEIKMVRPEQQRPRNDRPMAEFIGAEMRFGDKLVKGAPFSAETVREESKRLFDGSLVKTQTKGAIYRDGEGRVRRELPIESINGFPVYGRDNQPLRLTHIVDHVAGRAFSIDFSAKTFFPIPFSQSSPLMPKDEPQDAKTESLGKQTVEGIAAEGTRTTIEIPVGQIGNDRPVLVVTERWYSPELQIVIMSKHTDPFIGEVVFKLVNIKRGEPNADLFKIPTDFKHVESRPRNDDRRPPQRRPE